MPASQAGRRRFDPGRPLQNSSQHRPKKSRRYGAVKSDLLPLDLKSAQNVPVCAPIAQRFLDFVNELYRIVASTEVPTNFETVVVAPSTKLRPECPIVYTRFDTYRLAHLSLVSLCNEFRGSFVTYAQ